MLYGLGALVVALGAAAVWILPPLFELGAGYAAKLLTTAVFLQGRDVASIRSGELAFIPFLSVEVDREARTLDATCAWVTRRAIYRDGIGSQLIIDRTEDDLRAMAIPDLSPRGPSADAAWPLGDAGATEPVPGVDAAKLEAALAYAFEEPDRSARKGTRAVVVCYGGRIVGERYAPGFTKDTPLLGWSMTKSVVHALLGIRVGEGKLRKEQDALLEEWRGEGDPRRAITIDHLLRMSSGLDFDESYFDPRADAVVMLFRRGDAAGYAASAPLAHEPDTAFRYSSGTSNILCRVLRESFGGDDAAYWSFPRRRLFDRIGMRSAVLEMDAAGTFLGSSFLYATARDWARFGLLYLWDGVFAGERILPEGWTEYAATPTSTSPQRHYGAHWRINAGAEGNPSDRIYPKLPRDMRQAAGFQGQRLMVIPSRDVVVVRLGVTVKESRWDVTPLVLKVLDALPEAPAR